MRYIFIVNSYAGPINAEKEIVPNLLSQMKKLNLKYEVYKTNYSAHATKIAKKIAESKENITIFSCGGDGTLNEIIEGVYGYNNVSVACVPCGTGNDFIRNFTNDEKLFLNVENYINGNTIDIDLIEVNGKIAVSICSVGLDAKVAFNVSKFKRVKFLSGSGAYIASLLSCLIKPLGCKVKIIIDDIMKIENILLLSIANGGFYGGGFNSAPLADMCDSVIDLVTVKKISRFKIASIINYYKKGTHFSGNEVNEKFKDIITYQKVKKVVIKTNKKMYMNVDGECIETDKVEAKILPKAVKILLPNGVNGMCKVEENK